MDKRAFSAMPQTFTENWPGEIRSFSWEDYLTAIPSPLGVAASRGVTASRAIYTTSTPRATR